MAAGGGDGPVRGSGLPLGRFFGVPLFLAPSWLVIAAIITFSYADLIGSAVDGLSSGGAYLLSFAFAVLLALSLLAHELGHVAMCLALGLKVRRVVIFLLGGVSEIEGEARRAGEDFLVAVAGPLVTIVVAAAAGAGSLAADPGTVPRVVLAVLAWSNVTVAVFNLLPGLPLDGGKVLRAGVWRVTGSRLKGTKAAAYAGRAVALAVVLASVFLTPDDDFGLALAAIAMACLLGAFIWVNAGQAVAAASLESKLPLLRIDDLVRPVLHVPADLPVAEALRRAWESRLRGLLVVDTAGNPTAIVSEERIKAVPPQRRPWTAVSEVARPLGPGMTLHDSASGEAVLDAIRAVPASEYLVVGRDGAPVGLLATVDLATRLRAFAGLPAGSRR